MKLKEKKKRLPWDSHCSRLTSSLHCFNFANLFVYKKQNKKLKISKCETNPTFSQETIRKWSKRKEKCTHSLLLEKARQRNVGNEIRNHGENQSETNTGMGLTDTGIKRKQTAAKDRESVDNKRRLDCSFCFYAPRFSVSKSRPKKYFNGSSSFCFVPFYSIYMFIYYNALEIWLFYQIIL